MSKFSDWKLQKLEERFGLKEVFDHSILVEWLEEKTEIFEEETNFLKRLQNNVSRRINYYNEWELREKVISPILSLVNFDTDYFLAFSLRALSGIVDGEEISGFPDLMIAKGKQDPKQPYFCFHEFKKGIDHDGDPAGQCLAAMLVAQSQNENQFPIYGLFVIGSAWYFMLLNEKEYSISKDYSVRNQDIFEILRILKVLKNKLLIIAQK
ncbi:MAG: hypothetical protein EAZ97_03545 [Bacteroidetes bacterium]|nr:MAG: hypothetical protein EAZ97_03545 [Bacteroidota bacterium]